MQGSILSSILQTRKLRCVYGKHIVQVFRRSQWQSSEQNLNPCFRVQITLPESTLLIVPQNYLNTKDFSSGDSAAATFYKRHFAKKCISVSLSDTSGEQEMGREKMCNNSAHSFLAVTVSLTLDIIKSSEEELKQIQFFSEQGILVDKVKGGQGRCSSICSCKGGFCLSCQYNVYFVNIFVNFAALTLPKGYIEPNIISATMTLIDCISGSLSAENSYTKTL